MKRSSHYFSSMIWSFYTHGKFSISFYFVLGLGSRPREITLVFKKDLSINDGCDSSIGHESGADNLVASSEKTMF